MTNQEPASEAPLSVPEAAERLGISTVRVRQYIRSGQLQGFRDNRGHWRVVPPLSSRERLAAEAGGELSEADAVDLLVDEILELRDSLAERESRLARLDTLVERQQAALDRAVMLADQLRGERDAALDRAAAKEAESERLKALLDRTLAQLDAALARLDAEGRKHQAALAAIERGLAVLDRTTERMALDSEARQRLEAMLADATARLEALIDDKAASAALLARREATLERALGLLERMTEADRLAKQREAETRSLFSRVLRRLDGN